MQIDNEYKNKLNNIFLLLGNIKGASYVMPSFSVRIKLRNDIMINNASAGGLHIKSNDNLKIFGARCRYLGYETCDMTKEKLDVVRKIQSDADCCLYYNGYSTEQIFAISFDGIYITFTIKLTSPSSVNPPSYSVNIELVYDQCFSDAGDDHMGIAIMGMLQIYGNRCRYSGYETEDLEESYITTIKKSITSTAFNLLYDKSDKTKCFAISGEGISISFTKKV